MSVRISAVVCTHNRAAYLRKALQSLVDQTLPQELYEIIVVDNGSQDNTKQVVGEFYAMPNLRYLYEPVIGLSRARNTGWRNARGEYVAYLDDDAVACPWWLAKFLNVLETFEPSPGSVGGKCEPIWEAPKPDWLSDNMLYDLSLLHWSDVPIILDERQHLAGCNIAYPRKLLQAVGGFREDLGRQGNNLRTNEENHLRQQLVSLGHCSVYHPEILVGHHVSPSKLTKKWFREKAYWQGLSDCCVLNPDGRLPLAIRARLALARISWALPRLLLMLVASNSAKRFKRQCQVIESMGYVAGLLGAQPREVIS
ncbi:MAG: glycosyltransferase family 2 protein [Chloroflexi bacterium]|nr:glycosyltransferase family 2 protein [Chloroflexota bacterium]